MLKDRIYKFGLTKQKDVNLVQEILSVRIDSEKSKKTYYPSCNFSVSIKKTMVLIILHSDKNGYIVYACNYSYGVGEFYYISKKELKQLKDSFDIKLEKEKYSLGNWRMLWYKDDVIKEFKNPLETVKCELEKINEEINSKQSRFDMLLSAKNNLEKKFLS